MSFKQQFFNEVLPKGVNIASIPWIKHQDNFVGFTEYIDSIRPQHVQFPVMRGVDQFRRPYLVLKGDDWVQTFFQRYTDDKTIWTHGEYMGNALIKDTGNLLFQKENLKKIQDKISEINNKIV